MENTKKVFVADDDEDDRFLAKDSIAEIDNSIRVIETESGEDLIDQLRDEDDLSESIVIVDMNMSGMNGLETIEAIKADPEIPEVHTVMMSTSSDPKLIRKAEAAGVDEFFTKPSSFGALLNIFRKIFDTYFKR